MQQKLIQEHQIYLLVESKSLHQSRQLAFLVEGTVADIYIDQDAVGSGANTGEEATEGGESASQIGALTAANREGLVCSESGEVVGRLGIVLEEDV